MRNAHSRDSGGFTLFEVFAAITILALLCVLLTAVIQQTIERGKATRCVGNLRQLGIAFLAYAGDHSGKFPGKPTQLDSANKDITKGWQYKVGEYIGYNLKTATPALYACPSGIWIPEIDPRFGGWRGYAMNNYVQEESYQNNTVLGNGRQALLMEFWVEETHTMAATMMLLGTSQILAGGKKRMAWRHHGAMNVLAKDGSIFQTLPGESGSGADIIWKVLDDGTVLRDGKIRPYP